MILTSTTKSLGLACVLTLLLSGITQAVEKDSEGYLPLFNGKDLTGWQTTGNWSFDEDGVLALDPAPGKRGMFSYRLFLWSKMKFSDFVLDLEFKLEKGGG